MKKIINLITFLLVVCFVVQSSSCSKTDEPQTHCDSSNTAYIPSDAQSRFFFKEGTFWVYKNINTDELDTVMVKNWYHTIEPPLPAKYGEKYKNKCYERAAFKTISTKYNWQSVTIDFNNAFNQLDSSIEQYLITENNEYFVTYRWRYRGGVLIDSLSNGNKDRINNLTIQNKIYSDIIYYTSTPGFEASDYLKEGWYANKVGLIKVVRKDGTTWELINSNIIQ
jgi:hypothetical protein